MNARDDDTPRYNHDPAAGETHPPDADADPHAALNTPVSEIEGDDAWQRVGRRESVSDVTGMGRPQTSDTRGSDGDPVLRASDDEREARNPAQSTPFGEVDAEEDALHRVEEHTGVPLSDDERNSA